MMDSNMWQDAKANQPNKSENPEISVKVFVAYTVSGYGEVVCYGAGYKYFTLDEWDINGYYYTDELNVLAFAHIPEFKSQS